MTATMPRPEVDPAFTGAGATDAEVEAIRAVLATADANEIANRLAAIASEQSARVAADLLKIDTTDPRLADERTPLDGSVTPAKLSAATQRTQRDAGQSGCIGWGPGHVMTGVSNGWNPAITYAVRFVPSKDHTISKGVFNVTTAASTDDACSIGLADATGKVIANSTHATGRLFSSGKKVVPLQSSAALVAGSAYYSLFAFGAKGGANFVTVPFLQFMWNNANGFGSDWAGAGWGQIEITYAASTNPVPAVNTQLGTPQIPVGAAPPLLWIE